ncbi:MAG: hypothetical protein KF795_05840 [Labilithrix sp.]|nr:hypothetical protein [Labilithrix sp.]
MSVVHSSLRSALVLSTVLGSAASLLAIGCGEDAPDAAAPDASPDAPSTADDAASPSDAGVDPDARGAFDPADVPVVCDGSPCATELVAGGDHFCARMSDGTVRCWGDDTFGALGAGEPGDPDDPGDSKGADGGTTARVVADLGGVTQLSAAGGTTCARVDDGGVRCWGDNRYGELGLEIDPPLADWDPHPTPAPVALEEAATRVDVGHGTVCAVLASGKVWCWGRDDRLQLARDRGGPDPVFPDPFGGPGPASLEALTLTRATAGSFTTFGLSAAGEVWSWGALAGEDGVLSGRIASLSPARTPKRVAGLSKLTSFAASASVEVPYEMPPWDPSAPPPPPPPPPRAHACAIAGGEVYCWGRSYAGALCTGRPDREPLPALAPVSAKTWPQQVAVGDEITCARMTDGSVFCCGSDARGRLGTGSVAILSPWLAKASAFTGYAVQVATSNRAVCALVRDGSVQCWGSNEKGELGREPDESNHPSPVTIVF